MFVTLVDFNNDNRIEIQELFRFFNELYQNEISYEVVMHKVASIVYNTGETVETFFVHHEVDL